jgi:hypothetical protein
MLEEKIETLTKEVVALRLAIEAGGGAAAPAAKTPAAKKAPAKAAAVEPEHDADETGTMMRKAAKKDKPAVQKYIKSKKCDDLADLLTKPELFDGAYEFAEGIIEAPEEEDDDDV